MSETSINSYGTVIIGGGIAGVGLAYFLARNGGKKPVEAVAKWEATNVSRVSGFRHMIDRARLTTMPSTAMLAQLAGQARVLLNRA